MLTKEPVSIILDSDIETDSDDAGAVAVLHTLADRGEANILAMISSSPLEWGARCLAALNTYYNRSDIPIGTLVLDEGMKNADVEPYLNYVNQIDPVRLYNRTISQQYPSPLQQGAPIPNSTQVYRKQLAGQPDHSVVICAIGFLGPLACLLRSKPDLYSPLSGFELVQRKVKLLVSMGIGSFPEGKDRFNWMMDPKSAEYVLSHWPTPISVSEHGDDILTGSSLYKELEDGHPVRKAYALHLGGEGRSRSSWDQVAVLYAVRGACDLFEEKKGYNITYDASTNLHSWEPTKSEHTDVYIRPLSKPNQMAHLIESLMVSVKGK